MIIRCSCENSFCCPKLLWWSSLFLFPSTVNVVWGIPTIPELSQNALQNYCSFLKSLWLDGLRNVLQEGMWEFGLFQICHPSHMNKLFGQKKQVRINTCNVCDKTSALCTATSECFVSLFSASNRGKLSRSKYFVSVVISCKFWCLCIALFCFWHCRPFPNF